VKKLTRTYFHTIAEDIKKKDIRTVKSWCERHKLRYFKDGRDYYVLEEEYIEAFNNNEPVSFEQSGKGAEESLKKNAAYVPQGKESSKLMKSILNL